MDATVNEAAQSPAPQRSIERTEANVARGRMASIDGLFREFWGRGCTDSKTFLEQMSILMFARYLDIKATGDAGCPEPFKGLFNGKLDPRRWRNLVRAEPDEMFRILCDGVYPHLREHLFPQFEDAYFAIPTSRLVALSVRLIATLPTTADDAMGDLYEHVLSKSKTARAIGQFRTPAHIARFMVALVDPQPGELIGDPACGTGRLLASADDYRERKAAEQDIAADQGRLRAASTVFGCDIDPVMRRIAAMNMILRGAVNPAIHCEDALSRTFAHGPDPFDLVLANPPFSGAVDLDNLDPSLTKPAKTRATELLFLRRILGMLKEGGRSAVLVPDGVLSNSTKAHVALRKDLVSSHRLEGVISLVSGVFKPYSGVSTSILLFTKGGTTDHVFFGSIEADGFSLDTRRTPIDDNDLPTMLALWKARTPADQQDRRAKHFMVPRAEIEAQGFVLAMNRYSARRW